MSVEQLRMAKVSTLRRPVDVFVHYTWADAQGGRLVTAACGKIIHRSDARDQPTCPACKKAVERYENLKF